MTTFFTSGENIEGYWVLATGWMGLIFIQFAWYANPITLLALLLASEKPRTALLLSVLAFVLATGAFQLKEIPTGIHQSKLFIKEFGLGFYLWYVAQACFLLAMFSQYIKTYTKKDTPHL